MIDHGATGPANRAAWEATLRTEELNVSNDPTRAAPAWISVSTILRAEKSGPDSLSRVVTKQIHRLR